MATPSVQEIPLHAEILYSEEDVDRRIGEIALQIVNDYRDKDPLFVALMRGADPFASQLMKSITKQDPHFHPEKDNMIVTTYGGSRQVGEPRVVTDLAPDTVVQDRRVVLLDDILDTGATTAFVREHLTGAGAAQVDIAVLVDRMIPKDVQADIAGFTPHDERWLIGMGMDDKGLAHEGGRWLPYIAVALSQPND